MWVKVSAIKLCGLNLILGPTRLEKTNSCKLSLELQVTAEVLYLLQSLVRIIHSS